MDRSHHIQWVTPLPPDEVLERALLDREAARAVEAGRARRGPVLTPPVRLGDGDAVFLIGVPADETPQPSGFIVAVARAGPLLDEALKADLAQGSTIALLDHGAEFYRRGGSRGALPARRAGSQLDLPGAVWALNLVPSVDLLRGAQSELPAILLAAGAVMAGLAACTVHLLERAAERAREAEHASRALRTEMAERRQAEEEIRRLNAELEERVRLRTAELEAANRELEAFSYTVSHDLRAPLRAMDGLSRILLEEHASALSGQMSRYLQSVRQSAQQMDRLVTDLLAFSHVGRQPLQTKVLDPGELVRRALADLAHDRAGRAITLRIGDLGTCEADPALLKQVFLNLLSNAIKFTRGRNPAVIEVGRRDEPDVAYFVRDNGVGFDPRYRDKLFGVFQRLHLAEEYEGTGVGLAIVRRIVHRHGGRVWAEGAQNRGATFYFTLTGSRA